MRTKNKPWTKPYLLEHLEVQLSNDDFSSIQDVYLEIGSGKGDFLLKMAFNNPSLSFIGVEMNITCAGITAKKLVESGINNAKIVCEDAINIVPLMKDESVKTLFLNFSDPWPKKRHHKRRLTSDKFLNEYYRILVKGGRLIFKTDNIDLFNDSLEYFESSPFKLISITNNYSGDDPFDACTEYETKYKNKGTLINRVIYEK